MIKFITTSLILFFLSSICLGTDLGIDKIVKPQNRAILKTRYESITKYSEIHSLIKDIESLKDYSRLELVTSGNNIKWITRTSPLIYDISVVSTIFKKQALNPLLKKFIGQVNFENTSLIIQKALLLKTRNIGWVQML